MRSNKHGKVANRQSRFCVRLQGQAESAQAESAMTANRVLGVPGCGNKPCRSASGLELFSANFTGD